MRATSKKVISELSLSPNSDVYYCQPPCFNSHFLLSAGTLDIKAIPLFWAFPFCLREGLEVKCYSANAHVTISCVVPFYDKTGTCRK